MVKCQNCGQVNNQGSNFCRFCGSRIVVSQTPYQQPPPVQPPIQPQPQSFEYNPPKPYSWKTDEYQISEAKARKTQNFNQAQIGSFNAPQPLVQQGQSQMAYGYRCPRCGSQNLPHLERKISAAGWVVFAVLLVVFFPLFWVGFFIKEDVRVCPVCNSRV
jgi:RNA polymerase subunit RPABC4/transcription elongation factor Spt4